MTEQEQLFQEYADVAVEEAKRCSRRYRRPYSETIDHANFGLALLLYQGSNHDPEKLPLRRWLAVKLYHHMRELYLRGRHGTCDNLREFSRGRRELAASDRFDNWSSGASKSNEKVPDGFVAKPSWWDRVLREASEEGLALLHILRDAPRDLMSEIGPSCVLTPVVRQKRLYAYLMDVLDWEHDAIDAAFKEVRACMSL